MSKKKHGGRPAAASSGRKLPALLLSAAALVLIALVVWLWIAGSPFPRLEVDGFRISQEEYLRAMYQARNDVLSDHAAAGYSLTDWSAETPLGDPCQLTAQRALEILSEYYAVSTLAVERGYLADAGYEAMLENLEETNRQRQEALDSGAMVTGIPHFSAEDYLTYRATSLRLEFCNDPDNPETQVTPEELRQRYEADRDNLYRQPDDLELVFLLADAADDTLEQAFREAREMGELAAALEANPQLNAYYQEISVDPGNYGVYARSHGDILAWAADLQTGELSQVIRQDDRLCLVQCLQRTEHPYVPLEEVQSVVAQSIRESRYDALIAQRMEHTEIRGDLQALYRFTAEQLH